MKNKNKNLTQLISAISHQMQGPITRAKWILSDIDLKGQNKGNKEAMQAMKESIEELHFLVRDFSNVSQLEKGKIQVDMKEIDLVKICREVIETLKYITDLNGQKIVFKTDKKIIKTTSDKILLGEILRNVIANALKYSSNGKSKVNVSILSTKKRTIIEVLDNGIGIPKNAQKTVFRKLFRASNARKKIPDASGFGLYFSKHVADKIGVKLSLKSKENKGTKFLIEVPIKTTLK